VATMMPALGGPSRMRSHSSCVKSALPVMGCLLSLGLAGCSRRRYREVDIPVALFFG
jgi:hypothetical protein